MLDNNSRPLLAEGPANVNGAADTHIVERKSDTRRAARGTSRANLAPYHRAALQASAISDEVIDRRGYQTVMRTNTDVDPQLLLRRNGMSKRVWNDPQRYPGLFMSQYSVTGERVPGMYRPDKPRNDDKGRPRKYEAPQGRPSVLDVHPLNQAKLIDPAVPLWITEGIKKGDALTSAGVCAISLAGVYNWRNRMGTLGDWEDVPLRGREVIICFDSDAATNANVGRAMRRFGAWLRSKGATVWYCIVPSPLGAGVKVGADDFLAGGGTVEQLRAAAVRRLPELDPVDLELTDSKLAERVAADEFVEQFRFVYGLGWLEFDGRVWQEVGEERPIECVRGYLKGLLLDAVENNADSRRVQNLSRLQSRGRIRAIADLTKGMSAVGARVEDFDADPWLLNVGNGVLDLRTAELVAHDPGFLMRHGTTVDYLEGAAHPDWDKALLALPDPETARFLQAFLGTGATGFPPHEDLVLFLQGGGSNGKSTMLNGAQTALGSYAVSLLSSVLGGSRAEHPTELMDMLGARLVFMEETPDGHRLDMTKLKKVIGTEKITGRRMYRDSVSFPATHTTVITTNHRPVVLDTDHGTWRRLGMVPFPRTYSRDDEGADPLLRDRLIHGCEQQQAVLAWVVEGAQVWYQASCALPNMPAAVTTATQEWRRGCDVIFDFVAGTLCSEPTGFVESEDLRQKFNDEWIKPPHLPWGKQTFAERFADHPAMKDLGAVRGKHRTNRRAGFSGVRYLMRR